MLKQPTFEESVCMQFDSLAKKAIKCAAKNYFRDISRRYKKEYSFSDLTEKELSQLHTLDEHSCDFTTFSVLGINVTINNDKLCQALKTLPENKRNIILLSYFMDMSDAEIADQMHRVRSTIYRHRTSALKEIKKIMEEK